MRIRIFRAATLAEAIAQIRAELGIDALILSDRCRGNLVEVTAALETGDTPALRHAVPSASLSSSANDLEPFTPPETKQPDRRGRFVNEAGTANAAALAWHGLSPVLIAALSVGSLDAACARTFRFASLAIDAGDDPLLLAGPAGGGKTLTVARLATRLVLMGQQPMVITADGKRAGAVEQLAAFTRLLGLTMVAAGTPATLGRAVARREAGQPVLIDAPGLDLADKEQSSVLQALSEAAGAAMTLVLPCGLDPDEAQEIACAHAELGARTLIATRADVSRRLGGVLCAASASGLALAEAGVASAVADSLVSITPRFLGERLQRAGTIGSALAIPQATIQRATTQNAPDRITRSALPLHIAAQRRAASSP